MHSDVSKAIALAESNGAPDDHPLRPGEGFLCIDCEYDLGGLAPEGKCPECGAAISRSALSNRLVFSSPNWLKRVVLGLNMLRWSLLLGLLTPLLGILLVTAGGTEKWDRLFSQASLVCLAVIPTLGVWISTSAEPRGRNDARRERLILIVRLAILFWPLKLVLTTTNVWQGTTAAVRILGAIPFALAFFVSVAGFSVLLSDLFARLPAKRAARNLRIDSLIIALFAACVPVLLAIEYVWEPSFRIVFLGVPIAILWYSHRLGKSYRAMSRISKSQSRA
ncbi:MAG TPA: hypothetical protein VNT79_14860 [Phycisphaerae bacterium]|nr:hypothetical protein [Phycisphaerae bacterium]